MFLGHFAIGFGAKKYASQVSLGTLFLACQLADLVWPSLVLFGIEIVEIEPGNTTMTPLNFVHYPYAHSLFASIAWCAGFVTIYSLLNRVRIREVLVISIVVLSHWVLDLVTHAPDMPVTLTGTERYGLRLWDYPYIAVPVELLLFAIGFWMYCRQTRPLNQRGSLGLWALAIFLILVYFANIFGPAPPSSTVVAWSAQALWVLVAWGYWLDRHRISVTDS